MAASFTGGLDDNVFSAVFNAGAEFLRMSTGNSAMQAKLIEKGLIQSNIFAGDMSDMKKMALQLASGKDQSAFDKVIAAADRYAMRADAATLALVLKNAEANGLSEVEADMATMESMNFYKRGLSPTLQYASRLIPFFNAQIQGLNVLYKAARGQMPFEEQFENVMKLKAHGIVQNIGVSNYTAEQLRRAIKIGGTPKQGGLVSIQNEWSPRSRAWAEVRDICIEHGIAFLPWSPLGGIDVKGSLENGSYDAFAEVAKAHNVSKFAIAIAWHLATSPVAIPIPGASRKESILDSMTGLDVKLTAQEVELLDASLPPNPPLADELVPQPPFRS
jgi:diketogulonate reductase-like aldo/keto reductase